MFGMKDSDICDLLPVIKIIGVGNVGNNTVNYLINHGIDNVEFITIETADSMHQKSLASEIIKSSTVEVEIGEETTLIAKDDILRVIHGTDLLFIILEIGKYKETSIASLIASHAKGSGALTIGVVTTANGSVIKNHYKSSDIEIKKFKQHVDSFIRVPDVHCLNEAAKDENTYDNKCFENVEEFTYNIIKCISELISTPGLISLDFDDVKCILKNTGTAIVANGIGKGPNAAVKAAKKAISFPLMKEKIKDAKGILLNVIGSEDNLSMYEVTEASQIICEATNNGANIIWGAAIDNTLGDSVKVVIIASGYSVK